jgi:UDP-N-acetylglucosamine transferase subunit ALG13
VGTDHHPFDRLMRWLDEWLAGRPEGAIRCFVQAGTSIPPRRAPYRDFLTYPEMEAALRDASAVVCHGGPGTIVMALAAGKKPIVVPRTAALGEHVDDHQLVFSRRLSRDGTIWLAETQERFAELMDSVTADPRGFAASGAPPAEPPAVRELERLVDDLLAGARGRRP